MSLRFPSTIALLVLLVACGGDNESTSRRPDPVSVYAAMPDAAAWQPLFETFTDETGILVTVKTGDADLIVEAVIADNGAPPADVLLTDDIARIWTAAEEGGLRAVRSDEIESVLDSRLRDPDHLWSAVGIRTAKIVYDTRAIDLSEIGDYANLSDADFRGKLCLSSSSLPVNRALIAMLISDIDVRPAEIVVRGWKRNLAELVFATEEKLLDAIATGRCAAGIASDDVADLFIADNAQLAAVLPAVAHINVSATGVERHARNPDGAERLVKWLVANTAPGAAELQDISTHNIGLAGWRDEEAIKLAERASYP